MRLFEAIIEANHRALDGDKTAGVCVTEYAEELPVVALTCVDPRLNAILPNVVGLPGEQFIWLRNAGNIITAPLSSTMRSLGLACAVKGGKEIVVIGHTDCKVCQTTASQLLDRLRALGIERHLLPENLVDYFGMFASEPQNVIKACDIARRSPLIGPKIPVQGLMVNIETGRLEWIVNGYEHLARASDRWTEVARSTGQAVDAMKPLPDFQIGEMKFPETKIGETVTKAEDFLAATMGQLEHQPPPAPVPPAPSTPPKLPLPPTVRPRMSVRRGRR